MADVSTSPLCPKHPWDESYKLINNNSIFLFVGLITIITAPFIYWKLDNDITTARFLTEHERQLGIERLRANQNAATSYDFKWSQALEVFLEPKSWLFVAMAFLPNMGSALPALFGPLIMTGFGFDKYQSALLNIPMGAMQLLVILASCWAAYKAKLKSVVLAAFMLPVVVGIAILYAMDHSAANQGPLLFAYYLTAFIYAANPLLLSWLVGNTAGAAKTSTAIAFYQAGTSAGALSGPLLFTEEQAPAYRPGTRAVLGLFIAMLGCIFIQFWNLVFLNKRHKKSRIANGKSGDIKDTSMTVAVGTDGKHAHEPEMDDLPFKDITDKKNDEFIYIY